MYYGYNGQEIEDAEMENMRRDAHEQALFDEAYDRAVALGRPFEDHEVFGAIWEREQLELVPQLDDRYTLFREATATMRRLWAVKDVVYGYQVGRCSFFYRHVGCGIPRGDERAIRTEEIGNDGICVECFQPLVERTR